MGELAKVFSVIGDFATRVLKAVLKLDLIFDCQWKSKKAPTLGITKGGSCFQHELLHEKSNASFSIGFLWNKDDTKSQLFISVNNAHMLLSGKYLFATPICHNEEPSNEEGEMWYTASESINNDYFSETTSESRKDEIIEQILTEVVKSLNDQS